MSIQSNEALQGLLLLMLQYIYVLIVELDPNWTEWTNKFGKLDITANLKNIGKML